MGENLCILEMLRSSLFPGLVGLLVPLEEERPGLDEGSHTVAHCTQPHSQPGEHLARVTSPSPPRRFFLSVG